MHKRKMLKDNHPTMIKVMKMYDLAEELGISLSFGGSRVLVHDNDRDSNLPYLYMEDIEEYNHIDTWPPPTEFKLVYDNPEYLAEQDRLYKERRAKEVAEAKRAEEERKEAEKAKQEALAKALEEKEKAELIRLQQKYGYEPSVNAGLEDIEAGRTEDHNVVSERLQKKYNDEK